MQKGLSMSSYNNMSLFGTGTTSALKRFFDIVVSFAMLVVLSPVLLIFAVVSAVSTKSFPIFVQARMGKNNKAFNVFKFRTMRADTPSDVATAELADADSYITRVGGLMRRYSIDELPQIANILFGQMSFVGPRPVVVTETNLVELRTRNGACSVRPGLTGLAQISGRDFVNDHEKAKMDAFYAANLSISMDFRLLVQTLLYVVNAEDIHEGRRNGPDGTAEPSM